MRSTVLDFERCKELRLGVDCNIPIDVLVLQRDF